MPSSSISSAASSCGLQDQRPLQDVSLLSRSAALVDVDAEAEQHRWVPPDAKGLPVSLPSLGSVNHAKGSCKACLFAFHAVKACANGASCSFCHFEHPPKRRVKHI